MGNVKVNQSCISDNRGGTKSVVDRVHRYRVAACICIFLCSSCVSRDASLSRSNICQLNEWYQSVLPFSGARLIVVPCGEILTKDELLARIAAVDGKWGPDLLAFVRKTRIPPAVYYFAWYPVSKERIVIEFGYYTGGGKESGSDSIWFVDHGFGGLPRVPKLSRLWSQ